MKGKQSKMNKKEYSGNGKLSYLEFLRILAIFGVLYSHMYQYVISNQDLYEKSKLLYLLWNSMYTISKTAVALFFMISGCLLLGKTEPIAVILRKRVLRMVVVLIVCTFVFYVAMSNDDWSQFSFLGYLELLFGRGVGTYWYLYTYIAWLLSLPFLRPIINKEKDNLNLFKYMIFLKIIASVIIPVIEAFSGVSANSNFDIVFVYDIIFYSVMGFYYGKVCIVKKKGLYHLGRYSIRNFANRVAVDNYLITSEGTVVIRTVNDRYFFCYICNIFKCKVFFRKGANIGDDTKINLLVWWVCFCNLFNGKHFRRKNDVCIL